MNEEKQNEQKAAGKNHLRQSNPKSLSKRFVNSNGRKRKIPKREISTKTTLQKF
ncbi:MAG: hypothetical protein ACR2N3_16940 [Pyrinomonadaceae bacterium]